jgi:hypothetical protein
MASATTPARWDGGQFKLWKKKNQQNIILWVSGMCQTLKNFFQIQAFGGEHPTV